jgi:hypothetical protein
MFGSRRKPCRIDGHKAYLEAVEGAFGSDIDYAMLVKLCGHSRVTIPTADKP